VNVRTTEIGQDSRTEKRIGIRVCETGEAKGKKGRVKGRKKGSEI
jgi:hypothetical protein